MHFADEDNTSPVETEDNTPAEPAAEAVQSSDFIKDSALSETNRIAVNLPEIVFTADSSSISSETRASIHNLAETLLNCRIKRINIEGHTDNRGTDFGNLYLSNRRAEAVASILIEAGIPPEIIRTTGFGAGRPKYPNDSDINRSRNRRVEIVFTQY